MRIPRTSIAVAVLVASSCALASCGEDEVPASAVDGGVDPVPSTADAAAVDGAPTDAGAVMRSADGWWHTKVPPRDGSGAEKLVLEDVWATTTEAWAVASTGEVLHFADDAWTIEHRQAAALHAIWGSSVQDLWAVGDDGTVLHRAAHAENPRWENVVIPAAQKVSAVWGTGPSDVWLAAGPDGLYHASGAFGAPGFAFEAVAIPASMPGEPSGFARIWGDESDVWVSGPDPCSDPSSGSCPFEESRVFHLARRTDASAAWSDVPLNFSAFYAPQVVSGALLPDGGTILIGNDLFGGSGCARTAPIVDERGAEWLAPGLCSSYRGIWMQTARLGWVVGKDGLAQEYDGRDWRVARLTVTAVPLAAHLNAVRGSRAGEGRSTIWIVGEGVALRREHP